MLPSKIYLYDCVCVIVVFRCICRTCRVLIKSSLLRQSITHIPRSLFFSTFNFLRDFERIRAEPLFWVPRTKLSVLVLKQNVDYNAIRGPVPRDLGQTRRHTNDKLAIDEVTISHVIHMSRIHIHRESFGTKTDGKSKAISIDERSNIL